MTEALPLNTAAVILAAYIVILSLLFVILSLLFVILSEAKDLNPEVVRFAKDPSGRFAQNDIAR
jgi:preprotein translocase subunit SecG